MTTNKNLLIIFTKNPELGKVKTRLAASIGDFEAFQVYTRLLHITREAAKGSDGIRQVWFSDFLSSDDFWPVHEFEYRVQQGVDLGARMDHSFEQGFSVGFDKVVIIGSDCPTISSELINEAFHELSTHDAVIGPALDGGYYLLGLSSPFPPVFQNKPWSTDHVFSQTLSDLQQAGKSVFIMPTLRDVDDEEDWAFFVGMGLL